MQSVGILMTIVGLLIAGFIGVPMRFNLEKKIGSENFHKKFKEARKVGDPAAMRLYYVGISAMTLVSIGLLVVIMFGHAK